MKTKFLLFLIGLLILPQLLFAQSSNSLAQLVKIEHSCEGVGGSIEFELLVDPGDVSYYWEHGPQSLSLTNLAVGTYTLILQDLYGCQEEHEIDILDISSCQIISEVTDGIEPCTKVINLQVLSNGGVPIQEEALDIVWEDGSQAGLTRYVNTQFIGDGYQYCVDISVIANGNVCCSAEACIHIIPTPECFEGQNFTGGPVIINEINRKANGEHQYVELLIIGNGNCGETTDLRGFIVDDNNGLLIPPNDFVTPNNLDAIGINLGFISFKYITEWSAVPNGSLIVIHDEVSSHPSLPNDDPTDSDQDAVYVLSANNDTYLDAKTGTWNSVEMVQEYSGFFTESKWSLIKVNTNADGMQVRFPDGDYCHGISAGESAFADENNFPLWLTSESSTDCNCQFVETDYLDKVHFACAKASENTQTPGLANSSNNANLISSLRDCNSGFIGNSDNNLLIEKSNQKVERNTLEVFPNPFQNEIVLDYLSNENGTMKIEIFSVSGKLVHTRSFKTKQGEHIHQLKTNSFMSSGIFVLKFSFPDGEVMVKKLIKASQH